MTSPTTSFTQQLHRFKKQLEARATRVVRLTVVALGTTLIDKSPWGRWERWGEGWQDAKPMPPYVPGRFKNSWDYDFDVTPLTQFNSPDKSGADSTARIAAVKFALPFTMHYIVNNTPYAQVIEYGGAWHNIPDPTPPTGLLRTTVIEWRGILAEAVKVARGGAQ
jgi:hypothetical protein